MTIRIAGVAAGLCVAAIVSVAQAGDPTGTWKWSATFNNQTRELVFVQVKD